MNNTTMIGLVAVTIIGIGITAAYAVDIQLAGDVTVDGVLSNAAISADIDSIVTELQAMNTKLDGVTGIAGPEGPQGTPGADGMDGAQGPPGEGISETLFLTACQLTAPSIPVNSIVEISCSKPGLTTSNLAIGSLRFGPDCMFLKGTIITTPDEVRFELGNHCTVPSTSGLMSVGLIIFN